MIMTRCDVHLSGYLIIIIITLFQEDNIFSTYASLTYGLQLQK